MTSFSNQRAYICQLNSYQKTLRGFFQKSSHFEVLTRKKTEHLKAQSLKVCYTEKGLNPGKSMLMVDGSAGFSVVVLRRNVFGCD